MDEVWTHAAAIFFTFIGTYEGDEISGAAADAGYNATDDTITGTMRYHLGDDLPFTWRRVPPASVAKNAVKLPSDRGKKRT